jgi:mannose-6-phosphate isomerase-like protein (cupin superfamily)
MHRRRGLELRGDDLVTRARELRALALLLVAAALAPIGIAGCGGATQRPGAQQESELSRGSTGGESLGGATVQSADSSASVSATAPESDSASAESESDEGMAASVDSELPAPAALGAGSSSRDAMIAVPRPEPSPWDGRGWTLAPATPQRVMLARVELPPGGAFRPPTTSCQDVIVFVREGQLEATGTGIATTDAPITLYAGDAVRFGPEGDGMAVNVGARAARTVMAVARRAGTGPARVPAPTSDDCAIAAGHTDALRRPLRVASVSTTAPHVEAGGRLDVRVLLDADGAGAQHGALSWLEGTRDVVIGEHLHPGAAEILLVEEGEGTMRVGGRELAVRPGAALYIPEGALHSFRSAGTRPLRAIQVLAPAAPERRAR